MPLFFYFSYGAHKEKKGGECPWEETWPEEGTPRENDHGRFNTKAELSQPRTLPGRNAKTEADARRGPGRSLQVWGDLHGVARVATADRRVLHQQHKDPEMGHKQR